jgi:hypothetical protein
VGVVVFVDRNNDTVGVGGDLGYGVYYAAVVIFFILGGQDE